MKPMTGQHTRRPLLEEASILKTLAVMIFSHASVSIMCICVLFDLVVLGLPCFLLHRIYLIPPRLFYKITSMLIDWTTPVVLLPMVLTGTKVYSENIDLLIEAKSNNSLLLANHGSRIDWMVGMFIGHLKELGGVRCRVGFVCEALIQFMPIVGYYRKIICNDIFVWRSFEKDAPTINNNIRQFHRNGPDRMLFLSPEGVIVDHGTEDRDYVRQCQQFCKINDFKPFDYVLTPRYKGTTCLLDQVSNGGPVLSVCLVFVRNGKLLNTKLLSPSRVVPDIYDLNMGIGGSPISIFVHLREIDVASDKPFDAKRALMTEYEWKDSVLRKWDYQLRDKNNSPSWDKDFTPLNGSEMEVLLSHLMHGVVLKIVSIAFGYQIDMMTLFFSVFTCISLVHTIGWLLNETSMESVPFETGIKGVIALMCQMNAKFSKV